MKWGMISSLAAVAIANLYSSTWAGPGCCSKKTGETPATATVAGVDIEELYLTLQASLPNIQYLVGDETTGCSVTAQMARDQGKTVKYVVAKDSFENEADAEVQLAKLIESRLEELQTVQRVESAGGSCAHAAHGSSESKAKPALFRVAGLEFADAAMANKAAVLAKEAAAKITLTTRTTDKAPCCAKKSGQAAKAGEQYTIYVVGSEETPCPNGAKLLLAKAKIQAAVQAAATVLAS